MFKFISIRTKIFITMLGMTTACLTGFLLSSRNLVEKDKTASLFENNLTSLQTKAAFLRSIFQQWGSVASTMSLYLDQTTHSFGVIGNNLAANNPDLKLAACMLDNGVTQETMAFQAQQGWENRQDEFQKLALAKSKDAQKNPFELDTVSATARYYMRVVSAQDPASSAACVFVFSSAKMKSILIGEGASQYMLVQQNGDPLMWVDPDLTEKWNSIRPQFDFSAPVEVSKMVDAADGRYLAAKVPVEGGFAIIGMVPESIVKRTLRELMTRAATIFIIALMAVVVLSLVFSHGLTSNLAQLGAAVQKIAQGDFNFKFNIKSRDETSLLASSFSKMSAEIQRLLKETAEKSRMEAELRTAKTVQDTLFPESSAQLPAMAVEGYYRSASECGGDWWYYFEQKDWLYFVIADATGHGAPAALITACARAVTSLYATRENLDLDLWARGLNLAIYETSKGSVLMTALIARFNMVDGNFEWINCSHEFPLVRNGEGDWDFLLTETCARLGEKREYNARVEKSKLEPGQQVLLFTDGLYDVPNPKGKAFGEKNVLKTLQKTSGPAAEARKTLVEKLDSYSQGSELPDDVTLVFLERKNA